MKRLGLWLLFAALVPAFSVRAQVTRTDVTEITITRPWPDSLIGRGINIWDVKALNGASSTVFVSSRFDGLWRSRDSGKTWVQLGNLLPQWHVMSLGVCQKNCVYVGFFTRGITVSSDGGDTWRAINNELPAISEVSYITILTSDTLYIANYLRNVYRSYNAGQWWESLNVPSRYVRQVALNSYGHIFVGTQGDGVYRSMDDGRSWRSISDGITNPYIEALAIGPRGEIYVGTQHLSWGAGPGGIFRSTNGGDSWERLADPAVYQPEVGAIVVNSRGEIFVGYTGADRGSRGVRYSQDGGRTWRSLGPELEQYFVLALTFAPNGDLWIGTNDGPFRVEFKIVATPVERDPVVAREFHLAQNYPNPFNPSTSIQYQVSSRAQVKLSVYNMLGNEVATLVDGVKDRGVYTVIWNAELFPSGVYLCRLEANGSVATRKMILVK